MHVVTKTSFTRLVTSWPVADGTMCSVPGGKFLMGANEFYPEERPLRWASVDPFWIDRTPVTNHQFSEFVEDTGYVTVAEKSPDLREYPDADHALLEPGSAVFIAPEALPTALGPRDWWSYIPGACWKSPEGPGSSVAERRDHPVVHIALPDARAFAAWCGKDLPTEAEWEFAARGGLIGKTYAWGDILRPNGQQMANYWVGHFPFEDCCDGGLVRTTAVGTFDPNAFGVFDMIGNVWEWTCDQYSVNSSLRSSCCSSAEDIKETYVIKGGSFLCAENHCRRFRPAARHAQDRRTSTSHLGFRCVTRTRP